MSAAVRSHRIAGVMSPSCAYADTETVRHVVIAVRLVHYSIKKAAGTCRIALSGHDARQDGPGSGRG